MAATVNRDDTGDEKEETGMGNIAESGKVSGKVSGTVSGRVSGAVRAAGALCFFAGIFILAQAYTMAFHGIYLDCFDGAAGCSMRAYGKPTLLSALYGSGLAAMAGATIYAGLRALRGQPRRRASDAKPGA